MRGMATRRVLGVVRGLGAAGRWGALAVRWLTAELALELVPALRVSDHLDDVTSADGVSTCEVLRGGQRCCEGIATALRRHCEGGARVVGGEH